MPADALIRSICVATTPRAPAMIVTIYGDLVMPNGGVMGMAALIALCEQLGFSESLVRTAVSRLVAAGRLEGERHGRRSYYRLTEAAHREFSEVARQLHNPPPPPKGWAIHMAPATLAALQTPERPLGRLAGDLFLAPDRTAPNVDAQLTFQIASVSDSSALRDLAASIWPLDDLGNGYRAFLNRFSAPEMRGSAQQALLLRLLLVHEFRMLLLGDPRLPADGLPTDWPGEAARGLFEGLHRNLSQLADAAIAPLFEDMPALGDTGSAGRPLPAV